MSKSQRLLNLMMMINRKRKFTVGELANEFQVSSRTILRDLEELSELGVPLYSQVGPHGGYQVLNERILPPIAFTEEEAISIFFASHALRHYVNLPFKEASHSALQKFYHYMPGDVRDRIDELKNRIDFMTPKREAKCPYLSILLQGAVEQKVVVIRYESKGEKTERPIQPVGIYANNGLWYCPAYCFLRNGFRIFRCDKMHSAVFDHTNREPIDLRNIHLGNKGSFMQRTGGSYQKLYVELQQEGVHQCEAHLWLKNSLHVREDGSGWLDGSITARELTFFASFILGLGNKATIKEPPELVGELEKLISDVIKKYGQSNSKGLSR